jgi:excinuclease UvrABC helicase subunit UvrB
MEKFEFKPVDKDGQTNINFDQDQETNFKRKIFDEISTEYDLEDIEEKRKINDSIQPEITPEYLSELKDSDPDLFEEITRKMNEEAEDVIKEFDVKMNSVAQDLEAEEIRNKREELDLLYKNDRNEEYWKR